MSPVQEVLFSVVLGALVWSVWRVALTGRLPGNAVPESETDRRLTLLFLAALGLAFGIYLALTPFGVLPRLLGAFMVMGSAAIIRSALMPGAGKR